MAHEFSKKDIERTLEAARKAFQSGNLRETRKRIFSLQKHTLPSKYSEEIFEIYPKIRILALDLVFGAVVGIVLILLKKKKMKSEIPFGPFLCLATLIMMLYGSQIISWYWRLCGIISI